MHQVFYYTDHHVFACVRSAYNRIEKNMPRHHYVGVDTILHCRLKNKMIKMVLVMMLLVEIYELNIS